MEDEETLAMEELFHFSINICGKVPLLTQVNMQFHLKARAVVRQLPDPVQNQVHNLLSRVV